MTSLTRVRNPYNFSTPVTDAQLFVGRADALNDIEYYLDDASLNSKPVGLAIIGDRASGKTSLLNEIERQATKRAFSIARISLTEADAVSPVAFFDRLFTALMRTALSSSNKEGTGPSFGDQHDRVAAYFYDLLIGTGADGSDFPFLYPKLSAKNKIRGEASSFTLPEDILISDLDRLALSIPGPIILLLDECDVLARNRTVLQLLRNVFMEVLGYQLVLSGTPALFDVVDSVFSPIIRQFKKITVGPFASTDEVIRCIRQPLASLPDGADDNVFNSRDRTLINDIAEISGRRPYEIQLICHFMFRQLQSGPQRRMALSSEVIDTVLRELGYGHTLASRPLFSSFRNYDRKALEALAFYLTGERLVTFEQYRFIGQVRFEKVEDARGFLEHTLSQFVRDNVLYITSERVAFAGDDLDRIYLKYYARAQATVVPTAAFEFGTLLARAVRSFANARGVAGSIAPAMLSVAKPTGANDFWRVLKFLLGGEGQDEEGLSSSPMFRVGYEAILDKLKPGAPLEVTLVEMFVTSPWGRFVEPFLVDGWLDSDERDRRVLVADELRRRLASVNGSCAMELKQHLLPPAEEFILRIKGTANDSMMEAMRDIHWQRMYDFYTYKHDMVAALEEAQFLRVLVPHKYMCNVGYVLWRGGRHSEAKEMLKNAIDDGRDRAIAAFDLGVLLMEMTEYEDARRYLVLSSKEASRIDPNALELMVPYWDDKGLGLRLVERPNVHEAAEGALALLDRIQRA
jgi:hypothetical protein